MLPSRQNIQAPRKNGGKSVIFRPDPDDGGAGGAILRRSDRQSTIYNQRVVPFFNNQQCSMRRNKQERGPQKTQLIAVIFYHFPSTIVTAAPESDDRITKPRRIMTKTITIDPKKSTISPLLFGVDGYVKLSLLT